jgi:hypothetical protein
VRREWCEGLYDFVRHHTSYIIRARATVDRLYVPQAYSPYQVVSCKLAKAQSPSTVLLDEDDATADDNEMNLVRVCRNTEFRYPTQFLDYASNES